ncbi:unknown [Singapore grouper iridovirus]|uniref:Uncharacterized protein n=1 Tax=Singapore grouper iridovirus TaxID=262968 RepID=Q5YFJ0_9VIRU|nr:hypothetical protein ORF075R [Singapore grouper iridovirus]AAS18090.1 unknown [Singapore grouper iridovirus]WAU86784.1 hypothetical protein ORF075R [Singapore grouper iridovirus]
MDIDDIFGDLGDMTDDETGEETDDDFDENVEGGDYAEFPDDKENLSAIPLHERPLYNPKILAHGELLPNERILDFSILETAATRKIATEDYSDKELNLLPLVALVDRYTQLKALDSALRSEFRVVLDLPAVADMHLRNVAKLILYQRGKVTVPYAAYNLLRYAAKRGLINPPGHGKST